MSALRIGVDATSWVNRRGFGRFARNAVGRLVETDTEARYLLYVDEATAGAAALPARAEPRVVALSRPPSEAAAAGSSRSPLDLLRLTRAVRRDRPDAFLFPSLYTWFPVVGTRTVVGVHDTIAEENPRLTAPTRRERALLRTKHAWAIRAADGVFTVSEASRQAVSSRYGLAPEAVRVVPEAPDPVFGPRPHDAAAAGLAAAGVDGGRPFFVYAGGISPHKNVETLVDAYALLRARDASAPSLVLVGDLESETYLSSAASVRERIARRGVADGVLLPGFVSDETLACLYGASTAVVLPSLAEGFGLPAVEAAACGAAVVLSDIPPHRETLDGAAVFFDPLDAEALAGALGRLAGDERLRRELGARARAAAERLTWDGAAAELRALIRDTAALA